MKTNMKFNVKGVEVSVEFEGSVRELMGINTAMVVGTKEWLDLFQERGNQIFDLVDVAVDRAKQTSKRVIVAEKEVEDFNKIINPKTSK